ncbi:MAG: adenylate/guanylate cyclase domain-containing protein, partial [bacterium]
NMGSVQAFDYTVMGDVVNLGSRLEGANKQYGTKIMINELTYEQSKGEMFARELDLLRVKGKKLPVKTFHLMSSKDSPKAESIRMVIDIFTQGIYLYREQKWDKAIETFNKVLGIWADDEPSKVYIRRCQNFKINPPPHDWDGVFVMTTK